MSRSTAGQPARSRRIVVGAVAMAAASAAVVAQLAFAPASGAATAERGGPAARAAAEPPAKSIPFTTRFHAEMHGSITRVGNTLLTCDETKAPVKPGVASCLDARNGVGKGIYNNNYDMRYVNEYPGKFPLPASEGGGFETLYSSSGAVLGLPANSKVKYARLYWGGSRGIGRTVKPLSKVDGVLFKTPDGKDYHEINGSMKDIGWMTGIGEAKEAGYQASADVTALVRASGNGNYIVADMDSVVKPHSWGGWTLVVAYENCDKPLRDIRLFDGFETELPDSAPVTVKVGPLTVPKTGALAARLGYVTYDGDRTYTGDTVSVKSTNGPKMLISGPDNRVDDIMDSTITEDSPADRFVRTPDYENQMGYNSDRFDISPLLRHGDKGLTFTFQTKKDGYQVGAIYSYVNLDNSAVGG
jgi:hypothetical protein